MYTHLTKVVMMASILLSGCSTLSGPQTPAANESFQAKMPRSILVLPPINNTPDIRGTFSFLASVTPPIVDAGYYVFPVALMDQTFKENGLANAADIHQVSPKKLRDIFGADAALYINLTEYGSKYQVIQSTTAVAASARLIDLKSGEQIWQGSKRLAHADNNNNQNGLVGMLVGAAINQISNSITDRGYEVSNQVSWQLFSPRSNATKGIPFGPRAQHISR
jgi:hypothetical protein